jgi:hypothetical protein
MTFNATGRRRSAPAETDQPPDFKANSCLIAAVTRAKPVPVTLPRIPGCAASNRWADSPHSAAKRFRLPGAGAHYQGKEGPGPSQTSMSRIAVLRAGSKWVAPP